MSANERRTPKPAISSRGWRWRPASNDSEGLIVMKAERGSADGCDRRGEEAYPIRVPSQLRFAMSGRLFCPQPAMIILLLALSNQMASSPPSRPSPSQLGASKVQWLTALLWGAPKSCIRCATTPRVRMSLPPHPVVIPRLYIESVVKCCPETPTATAALGVPRIRPIDDLVCGVRCGAPRQSENHLNFAAPVRGIAGVVVL